MAFRLRKDARTWFKTLEGSLSSSAPLFELYYFCVAVGLSRNRKAEISNDDTDELVDYYPGEFRSRGRVITAWLITKELEGLGISLNERPQIHQAISKLVDPQSPSWLSEHGMREINRYASGGFDALSEYISDPPRSLPSFLISFHRIVTPDN
ncbi:hypothetical protein [Methylotetracoccus oryzae]|uniref:hypothetical protein n=1 Tax=Methylotetracoccus oryzae TaxID=1919059 RepID=UPI001117C536|nr:hypothetical protein [Methylotetracoccus oryzae]